MPTPQEPDFPPGHPARCDYDPSSPEAKEWARLHIHPKGERDFPVGHPKALDTPGNSNATPLRPGVDPARPDFEAFSGRSPEQAKAFRDMLDVLAAEAKESPALQPTIALNPPKALGVARAAAREGGDGYVIFCPGCECGHYFDSRWQFNGSLELPTFTPSYLTEGGANNVRCHSYVTNGRIQFLADSGHKLSGQTVELPPIAEIEETIHAQRS
jgi:hypothetical protein